MNCDYCGKEKKVATSKHGSWCADCVKERVLSVLSGRWGHDNWSIYVSEFNLVDDYYEVTVKFSLGGVAREWILRVWVQGRDLVFSAFNNDSTGVDLDALWEWFFYDLNFRPGESAICVAVSNGPAQT